MTDLDTTPLTKREALALAKELLDFLERFPQPDIHSLNTTRRRIEQALTGVSNDHIRQAPPIVC
jgi:hypothetical protein